MGKFYEKILAVLLKLQYNNITLAYLEGLAMEQANLVFLENLLLQLKWACETSRGQLQEGSSSCLFPGQPYLTFLLGQAIGCPQFILYNTHTETPGKSLEGNGMVQVSER